MNSTQSAPRAQPESYTPLAYVTEDQFAHALADARRLGYGRLPAQPQPIAVSKSLLPHQLGHMITIDNRIKSHMPALRSDEFRQLEENIIREGCKSPLVVWGNILVDGHNRFQICTDHGIPFDIEQRDFSDIDEAIDWVEENQLGRRNLSPDQFSYFIGRKYDRLKGGRGGLREAKCQNDTLDTAEKIASEHGISARTVKRAAEFSRNVDAIADHIGDSARAEILSGDIQATRDEVAEAAKALPIAQEQGLTFASRKEAFDWVKQEHAKKAEVRRSERIEKIAEISKGNADLPTSQKYPVIYADPPWRYESPGMGGTSRSIENHYPTMPLEEICALPVSELATDDAILYLWATSPKLGESFKVIEAWGFDYRTSFVWVKDKIGMGYHARNQHELLLVAKRGDIPAPAVADRVSSVIEADRGEHSAKPDKVYSLIESFYPTLQKIELFSRSPREGWAAWGNQASSLKIN